MFSGPYRHSRPWSEAGLKWEFCKHLGKVWYLAGGVLLVQFVPLAIAEAFWFLPRPLAPHQHPGLGGTWLLALALILTLLEELVFRVTIQERLSWFIGTPLAILVAATLFGLAHEIGTSGSFSVKATDWLGVALDWCVLRAHLRQDQESPADVGDPLRRGRGCDHRAHHDPLTAVTLAQLGASRSAQGSFGNTGLGDSPFVRASMSGVAREHPPPISDSRGTVFTPSVVRGPWTVCVAVYRRSGHLPIGKVPVILSTMENNAEPHIPSAAEASAALNDAEEARATLAQSTKMPSWFFASIGAAIAVQIATTAVGVADPSSSTLAALATGIVVLVAVAGVQLARFRRLNGVRLGGLLSRVVLGTGTLASASYAVAVGGSLGGLRQAVVAGRDRIDHRRRLVRAERAPMAPCLPDRARVARARRIAHVAGLLTVAALAGLALLLLYH